MTATEKPALAYDSRANPWFPHQVLMETTSACQLRCKMCAREDAMKRGTLKTGEMKQWLAEKIIDEVASENPDTRLWFCYFGEPTISRKLWDRIRLAKDRGINATIINTNGNLLKPDRAEAMIASGLDEVYIGLDAASAETYAKIRIRGNYDVVVANIEHLLRIKPPTLKVTVQFGVYEENEHELETFNRFWSDKDVSRFIRPKLTWIGSLPEHFHTHAGRYPCPWIFDSFPIYFDGLVPYCICDWDNRLPSGNINTQSIKEVWQGTYRNWQDLHATGRFDELPEFCRNCRDWQSKPLKGALQTMFENGWSFDDCNVATRSSEIDTQTVKQNLDE